MAIQLASDVSNYLYAARAQRMSEGVKLIIADTQARVEGSGSLGWQVECAQTEAFGVDVCYCATETVKARIMGPFGTIEAVMPPTRGYFANPHMNFERLAVPGRIELPAGLCQLTLEVSGACLISSIELRTPAAEVRDRQANADARAAWAPIAPYLQGYGFMFHWVAQSMPRAGEPIPYKRAVEQFDAEAFADMVEQAGGRYVYFTTNHDKPHFPAPVSAWERYFPGMTTQRDLIEEIGRALERRGIALMLYINFTAAYFSEYLHIDGNAYTSETGEFEPYSRLACEVLEEIGTRYGKLVKGFWIDACYQLHRQCVQADFEPIYRASKVGFADRVTAFNYWILPVACPYTDIWAAEVCDTIALPDAYEFTCGCAKGLRPHALLLMEDNWWHDKLNAPIAAPRFTLQQLADFIQGMKLAGGMTTINLQIYQDGGIGQRTLNELKQLKQIIY